MRMRGLAALCGLMFLAGCSSVDISAPIEDRSTPSPEVSVPVESTEAHSVPVPSEGTFQPRHLTTEPTPQASGRTHVVVQGDTIYNIILWDASCRSPFRVRTVANRPLPLPR